jgi:phage tail tape-measure protein
MQRTTLEKDMADHNDNLKHEVEESQKNGRLAGAGAGVVAGAQLGTVLLPIPVVGTFTGALVGGLLGARFGKKVVGTVREKVNSFRTSPADVSAELVRLAKLREQGILTEEEFAAAKARLLGV